MRNRYDRYKLKNTTKVEYTTKVVDLLNGDRPMPYPMWPKSLSDVAVAIEE